MLFCAVLVIAPVIDLQIVWYVAYILNALMAIPILVAVVLLSGMVARDTKYYLAHIDEKEDAELPVID